MPRRRPLRRLACRLVVSEQKEGDNLFDTHKVRLSDKRSIAGSAPENETPKRHQLGARGGEVQGSRNKQIDSSGAV
jgi:hypothetical protein